MNDKDEITNGVAAPQCGSTYHRGWYSRGYMPHFDSPCTMQHISYHLADSLPIEAINRMQSEASAFSSDDTKRNADFHNRIELYLNSGHGSCILRESEIAACVEETWLRFDGERYHLLEWVVMPNHCHVLIEPYEGASLAKIVLSWKNYTARYINDFLDSRTPVRQNQTGECRTGVRRSQVWAREYWDRYIRNEHHYEAVKYYIRMNPVKAGLAIKPEDWTWSSAKSVKVNDEAG